MKQLAKEIEKYKKQIADQQVIINANQKKQEEKNELIREYKAELESIRNPQGFKGFLKEMSAITETADELERLNEEKMQNFIELDDLLEETYLKAERERKKLSEPSVRSLRRRKTTLKDNKGDTSSVAQSTSNAEAESQWKFIKKQHATVGA